MDILSWTHRDGQLQLTLVLPDGSRSLIPATWTNLNHPTVTAQTPSAGLIGSIQDLLHARTIIDALLEMLAQVEPPLTAPPKEDRIRARATGSVARRAAPARRTGTLGNTEQNGSGDADRRTGWIDQQSGPAQTAMSEEGERP